MSRGKYGNPKTASRFICCKHLGENFIGQGIQRGSRQREKYHIKDLFCLQCACVTKCIEWRWCDDYEKVMEQADKLHKEMAMMIYTWMAIMIMIGMTVIMIMPMVWMTQWMNLTRIGKYGRQIVKKRSRNDIILDRIRKQDTENMI